jgi:hypothetical protein
VAVASYRLVKFLSIILCLIILTASAEIKENSKKPELSEVWVCGRWTWTGDVFNRKVYCLEWAKKDCSNRLHKEICKHGG